ncbi:MAG: DNA translocase FtsK [Neisseria sp.]|nr:DNA translocase FtsK [Neisseria sp.]
MWWFVLVFILLVAIVGLLEWKRRLQAAWEYEESFLNRHNQEQLPVHETADEIYGAAPNVSVAREETRTHERNRETYERAVEKMRDLRPKRFKQLNQLKNVGDELETKDAEDLPIFAAAPKSLEQLNEEFQELDGALAEHEREPLLISEEAESLKDICKNVQRVAAQWRWNEWQTPTRGAWHSQPDADAEVITLESIALQTANLKTERAEKTAAVWRDETSPEMSAFDAKNMHAPSEDLPVIGLDDPAVVRQREKVKQELSEWEMPVEEPSKPRFGQFSFTRTMPEAVRVPSAELPEIIGEEDIRANLLRSRQVRSRQTLNEAPPSLKRPRTIPEAEVIANLAKDSPVHRRLRRISTASQNSVLPAGARVDDAHSSRVVAKKVNSNTQLKRSNSALSNRFAPYPQSTPQATKAVANNPVVSASASSERAPAAPKIVPTEAAESAQTEAATASPSLASATTANVAIAAPAMNIVPAPDATVVEQPAVPETPRWTVDIPPVPSFETPNPSPAAASLASTWSGNERSNELNAEDDASAVPSVWAKEWQEAVRNELAEASYDYDGEMPSAEWLNEWRNDGNDLAEFDDADEHEENEFAEDADGNGYPLPNLDLLLPAEYNPEAKPSEEMLLDNSITIEEKLAEFRVKVKVLDAYAGPVITRYEIEPDVGVRGNSVINLEKDLARSLGVSSIRVVETIPGKTCMGLELPNPKRQMIRLSEIFAAPEFQESKSKLTLALGQDITGQPVVTDLAKAPHLLVAGTTGSGKSVGVNAMILSMLFKANPEDVRMIMIDPKMLELSIYEGIPHLLAPVVTDMKLAANALNWCVNEMEKRYRLMSHLGVRNLAGYNQKVKEAAKEGRKLANPFSLTPDNPEPLEKLPFIVVVVDEFADLMMTAGKQIEQLIARLAQKARAAGIHLILATQRPSVDVITGLIKANIPTRIAFQVSSKIDSRTILDQMGAENLLGQGDMLFLPPGTGYPKRVHGAFASDDEVHQVVEYLKQFGEPNYVEDIFTTGVGSDDMFSNANDGRNNDGERDPLYDEAVASVIKAGKVSISSVQRYLRIGYNRAANLVEQMENDGIVSAADHSGKRTVLARSSSHLDD